jgi:hypothetical protein
LISVGRLIPPSGEQSENAQLHQIWHMAASSV